MLIPRIHRVLIVSLVTACGFVSALGSVARADNSLGAGIFVPSDGSSALAATGTLSLSSVPGVPVRPQLSGAVAAGQGGRFAAALEANASFKGTFLGGGVGVGKLSQRADSQTGTLFDAFVGQHVAPLTSLQLRYYAGSGSRVGSALFAGVSFSL